MSTNTPKSLILNEIKLHYQLDSDAEFARFLGIKPQTLSSWRTRNTIDYDLLYSKCVGVNADYLFSGQGPLFKDESVATTNEFVLRSDTREPEQKIPLYDVEAAAGLVKLFEGHENIIDYISIPNLPKCDGAIYIKGDSMYPLLKSGDIAIYKRVYDFLHGIFFGEMYLVSVLIDDEHSIVVKYVQRSEKGDEWVKLVSQNAHHAPKDFPLSKVTGMALVKATIRINSML